MISTTKCPYCGQERKSAGFSKHGGIWTAILVFLFFGGSNVYCSEECREAAYAKNRHAKREKTLYFRFLWFLIIISALILVVFLAIVTKFGMQALDFEKLASGKIFILGCSQKALFLYVSLVLGVSILLAILRIVVIHKTAKRHEDAEEAQKKAIERADRRKDRLEKNKKLESKDGLSNGLLMSSICPMCQAKTSRLYVCTKCKKSWCSQCNSEDIYHCPSCGSSEVLVTEWDDALNNESNEMFKDGKCNQEFLDKIRDHKRFKTRP